MDKNTANPFLKNNSSQLQSSNIFSSVSRSSTTASNTAPLFQPSRLYSTATSTIPKSEEDGKASKPTAFLFDTLHGTSTDVASPGSSEAKTIFGGKLIVPSKIASFGNPWIPTSLGATNSTAPILSVVSKSNFIFDNKETIKGSSLSSNISSVASFGAINPTFVQSSKAVPQEGFSSRNTKNATFGSFTDAGGILPTTTPMPSSKTRVDERSPIEKAAGFGFNYLPSPPSLLSKKEPPTTSETRNTEDPDVFPHQEKSNFSLSKLIKEPTFLSASDKVKGQKYPEKVSNVSPLSESTTLIAVDINEKYLDESVLKNHFERFGDIKRIKVNRKTNQASIYFTDHKSASEAKSKGKKLHPLVPEMKLFFGTRIESTSKARSLKTSKPRPLEKEHQPDRPISTLLEIPKSCSPIPKVFGSVKLPADDSNQKKIAVSRREDVGGKAPSENLSSVKDTPALLASEAKNTYDRFLILDARDKDIRSRVKREVDVKKAKYLLASCPDMCPEKERYSRDIQYDVSLFEMTNGKMDPKLCIKKFSRSSADKDEPLPHELRPGPVLKMTMDFLSSNIIPKGDESDVQIDLWYNYLCNRTRALRNDITQQHLTDPNAVYVLERCTRFHIHCSHSLCEESSDNFDPKINSEHLSKSLQSLKELYEDLGEKGVYFKTESEFRSYEMLLSVNDGNVILRYLKFPECVQQSKDVQFAIKVLTSIHTNNYVKFFKLIKEATYLQACIMHRYFNAMRIRALPVIVRSYPQQMLHTETFKDMLGLSNANQIQNFVRPFGIDVNEESKVVISKSSFASKPETLPAQFKSTTILDRRGKRSLPEIIENGTLPRNPLSYYTPHDSFDCMGYLKRKALDALDQSPSKSNCEPIQDYIKSTSDSNVECRAKGEKDSYINSRLERELEHRVDTMVRLNLLNKYFTQMKKHTAVVKTKKRSLVLKFGLLWKEKAMRRREIDRNTINKYLQFKYIREWKKYVHDCKTLKNILIEAKEMERKLLMKKFYLLWRRNCFRSIAMRIRINNRKISLSHKFFKIWRDNTIAASKEKQSLLFYKTSVVKKAFAAWQGFSLHMKNKRMKLNFEAFPAAGSSLSLQERNSHLHWGYLRDNKENLTALQIYDINDGITRKAEKHFYIQQISGMLAWSPLPLISKIKSDLIWKERDFYGNLFGKFMKIQILVDEKVDSYFLIWVRRKFDFAEDLKDIHNPINCTARFTSQGTNYCIIVRENYWKESHTFNDATLVIIVGHEDNMERFNSYISRLGNTAHLVLCCNPKRAYCNENVWSINKDLIHSPETTEKLVELICKVWLSRGSKGNLLVNSSSIIVSKFISKFVLSPISKEVGRRLSFERRLIPPQKIVNLYNSSIEYLKLNLKISKDISRNVLPAEVTSSNDESHCLDTRKIEQILLPALDKLLLPHFSIDSQTFTENDLYEYVRDVAGHQWDSGLLSEVRKILQDSTRLNPVEECSVESFYSIPWADVLICCIFFKLSHIPDINTPYQPNNINSFDSEKLLSDMRQSHLVIPSKRDASKRKQISVSNEPQKKSKTACQSLLLLDLEHEKLRAVECEKWIDSFTVVDDELEQLCQLHGIDLH